MYGLSRSVRDLENSPFFAVIRRESISTGAWFASKRTKKSVGEVVSMTGPSVESMTCGRWIAIRGPEGSARVRGGGCHASVVNRNCLASWGVKSISLF